MLTALLCVCSSGRAQVIDFESLPSGLPTMDEMPISDQYEAALGVRFDLVDAVTLLPIGSPLIAKVGAPATAFDGCGPDTPFDLSTTGLAFLTDDDSITNEAGTLLLTYSTPVAAAAGIIIDVDRRSASVFEEWTIEALDASMQVLDTRVLTAPIGDDVCNNNQGPGDAGALGFAFEREQADIGYILIRYTGNAGSVGLAFDNFWPASIPPAPAVALQSSPPEGACYGDVFTIRAVPESGLFGYTVQWQQAAAGEEFSDMNGERSFELAAPVVDGQRYRAVIRDALGREAISGEVVAPASREVRWSLAIETGAGTGEFTELSGIIAPYLLPTNIDAYYGWRSNEEFFHGPLPILSMNRSHMFLSIGAGGTSVVIVHDAVTSNGGGRAEMVLEFDGAAPSFQARDDPNDGYRGEGTSLIEVRHNWVSPNTDGFAVGPLPGSWSSEIRFSDVFSGNPTIGGLGTWAFMSGDGVAIELPLEEDRRVRLVGSCPCPGDVNADGTVNLADLNLVLGNFGQTTPDGDTNGDGQINLADLNAVLAAFGQTCL